MKLHKTITLAFILSFVNVAVSQTTIEIPKGRQWYVSATQFEDKSYVVSCEHAEEPAKIIFFDENGKQTFSKTLSGKELWTFSDRPMNANFYYETVPLIDKTKKLCYNLISVKNKLSVQIVNEKLECETITLNGEVYSKFDGLMKYSETIRNFDSEGNPFWAITQNRRGFLYVKYNIKNKTIEHRFLEHEGYSNVFQGYNYISAGLIGYLDEKIWYARITDRGHKKAQTEITIYSIDQKMNVKEENKIALNKAEDDLGFSIEMVNQNDLNTNGKMYFTVNTIKANNSQGSTSFYFISFDGNEWSSAQWLYDIKKSYNVIHNKTFLAAETGENEVRFVLGDEYGRALAFDVNFEDKAIFNISGVELFKDKAIVEKNYTTPFYLQDQIVFTSLLYDTIVTEETREKVEEIFENKETPILFKGVGNKFFVISADYQITVPTYKTQF